jgi:hypothetical protein
MAFIRTACGLYEISVCYLQASALHIQIRGSSEGGKSLHPFGVFFSADKTVCVGLPHSSKLGRDVLVTCAGHYMIKATVCWVIRELKTVEDVP